MAPFMQVGDWIVDAMVDEIVIPGGGVNEVEIEQKDESQAVAVLKLLTAHLLLPCYQLIPLVTHHHLY